MRASDLLRHITVKNRILPPGKILRHLRWLPVLMCPEQQSEFHGSAMYGETFTRDRAGEDAWEQAAQVAMFVQQELLPPGGVTADSKPADDEELPDGPISLDRGS
ncbi:MAG: hypothetical protein GEU87_02395 [Alphaproteobacteria bacterium]|nr:hypothetical protein [Alphaproteobacteria bacterium]